MVESTWNLCDLEEDKQIERQFLLLVVVVLCKACLIVSFERGNTVLFKTKLEELETCSSVKSTCLACRGPPFSSQYVLNLCLWR